MKKKLIALTIVLLLTGCSKDDDVKTITEIRLSKTEMSINIGEEATLAVSYSPSELPAPSYEWSSSNEDIVSVSNGKLQANKVGESTITIIVPGSSLKSSCKVIVTPIEANLIKLSSNSETLKIGESINLTYTITPNNTTNKDVEWSTTDASIATVADGVVTSVTDGECEVIILVKGTNITDKCKIKVAPIEANSIKLSSNSETAEIGNKIRLTYKIYPENTTYKDVEWSTSDASIATVADDNVTPVSDGICEISVTVKGTQISDKCIITVNPIKVSGITINERDKTIEKGELFTLSVDVLPDNAKNKSIIWNSSNISIATVENGVVNALSNGRCDITATTVDGNFRAVCAVNVAPVSVKSILFDKNDISILENEKMQLTYLISPNNAENKSVTFISSDDNVVLVDNNGNITAVNKGSATIKVTTKDGNYSSICNVVVKSITNFMSFSYNSSVIQIGGMIKVSTSSTITNKSTHSITLTKFTAIDPANGSIIQETTDKSQLGELKPGYSKSLGLSLNKEKYPTYKWTFEFNGKSYSVENSRR